MSRAARAGALALAMVAGLPGHGRSQAVPLNVVDSLVTAGDYGAARTAIERWWSARESLEVPASDVARAHVLRAQLASDPSLAESDYLAVALGYPASEHAPHALLRLGQGLLATGDATRAVAYLDRLVADYPGRPERLTGLLWLARANSVAGRPAAACDAARTGLQDARDPDIAAMLREETGACSNATPDVAGSSGRTSEAAARPPETTARPAPASSVAADPDERVGDWAVQAGAFRYRAGADALLERLRGAGYSPRLVRVPANDLLRVRVGRFTTSGEAAALLRRIRAGGFDAVVVGDAGREREP